MEYYGISALVKLLCAFCFIYLAFYSLQSLELKTFFKKGHDGQIRVLFLLLAIVIGYTANNFFFEILDLSKNFMITIMR